MPGTITHFGTLQTRFFEFYNAENFQAALDLLRSDSVELPHHAPVIAFWEAAMLARLNRVDEAMSRLSAALDAGHWMHEEGLRGDPDFAALLDQPGIDDLIARLRTARVQAASEIEPLLSVSEPETRENNGRKNPWPLLLALHGNLGNIPEFAPYWQSAVAAGWLVAIPQSIQPTWVSDFYVWDDVGRARHQIAHHMSTLREVYRIDPNREVLAGFSMGGEVAMQAALDGTVSARGFIGVEGWIFDQERIPAVLDAGQNPGLRVYLVAGRDTQFHEDADAVRALLRERGYACELEAVDVPDHGFPADFADVLERALAFVDAGNALDDDDEDD